MMATAPVLMLAGELAIGLRVRKGEPETGDAPPFCVLIPAHDEATCIAETIATVRAQLRPCDRVTVVADHCSDMTARLARQAGADVVKRHASNDRGKGHALAFGRRAIAGEPHAVVIVLDADCVPMPGALAKLALAAIGHGGAVQGRYLMVPPPNAAPLLRISCFAFLLKNGPRQLALDRLGGRVLLQGSGMAFPRALFDKMPLASSSLAEDMELGLALALSGERIRFVPEARIISAASTEAATTGQRRRWTHGEMAIGLRFVPRLLAAALTGKPGLLALVADRLVPPTVPLIAAAGAIWLVLAGTGGLSPPVLILGAGLSLLAAMIVTAWAAIGRAILPARALLSLPGYVRWVLPVWASFIWRRETAWIRTSRER